MGILGIIVIVAACWALSADRGRVRWSVVAWGVGLQAALALLILKTPAGEVFEAIGLGFNKTMAYAEEGSSFVFGPLGSSDGPVGVTIAFQVLPLIIFIASLFAVLYYIGLMQLVLKAMAWAMQRTLGVSGAEALNVAANVFMGQNEAPLTIRPYLDGLTRSELMLLMTGGMATVSGALMVAYAQIGNVPVRHLLTAVIITAPAAIALAKILEPETATPATLGKLPDSVEAPDRNVIEAAARGAGEGLHLSLMVGAVLVAFVGIIALLNGIVGGVREWSGLLWLPPDVQTALGWLFSPVAYLLGVSWGDAAVVGKLLGTRVALNEFIAYVELGQIKDTLDPRSFLIVSYALCGFANIGSIGVQVGGVGSLIPERRGEMAELGMRAMFAATGANFMTAAVAGLLV